jgi:hypothetical protein
MVNYNLINNESGQTTWVDDYGTQYWFLNGLLHQDHDLPAIIHSSGIQEWYQYDKLHRENDLPAILGIYCDREEEIHKEWYKNGILHRDNNKPARIHTYGSVQEWYKDGKLHRDNDLPAVINYDVSYPDLPICEWYKNGELHRDGDNPAISSFRHNEWYQFGKLHRENDLPAIQSFGNKLWFKNGLLHRDKIEYGHNPAVIIVTNGNKNYRGCIVPALDTQNRIHQEWWVSGKVIKIINMNDKCIDNVTKNDLNIYTKNFYNSNIY